MSQTETVPHSLPDTGHAPGNSNETKPIASQLAKTVDFRSVSQYRSTPLALKQHF